MPEGVVPFIAQKQCGAPPDDAHHRSVHPVYPLTAPPHWQKLAFLSDVHLQEADPATFQAWATAIGQISADALFILGDLFEVWVGDDVLNHPTEGPFWAHCAQVLQKVTKKMPVYFMPGNRDFLVGSQFLSEAGMQALSDPTLLGWQHTHWLLTHGDLLCTDDHPYQVFRQQVRSPEWQHAFLARPIRERLDLARQMRKDSATHQAAEGAIWADVNAHTVEQWMLEHQAPVLVHGHTHRPAIHRLANTASPTQWRVVLSDWDARATPPRVHWLEASAPSIETPTPNFQIKTTSPQ